MPLMNPEVPRSRSRRVSLEDCRGESGVLISHLEDAHRCAEDLLHDVRRRGVTGRRARLLADSILHLVERAYALDASMADPPKK